MTTLIEIINDMLRATRSHPVSSWDDTDESRSCAYIVRRQIDNLLPKYNDVTKVNKIRELTPKSDLSFPTSFVIDVEIEDIEWIKYKVDGKYRIVTYCTPEDFLSRADMLDTTQTYATTVAINSVDVPIYNDRDPKYWTSFNNSDILMDAYDSTVDSTLQQSKSQAYVREPFTFVFSNTFVIPLDRSMLATLKEECISSATVEFKGMVNPKAEYQARRGRILEAANQYKKSWVAYGRQ